MSGTALHAGDPSLRASAIFDTRRLKEALRAAGPPLVFGLRLWASVCLALYVAFWLDLDHAFWAGTSAAFAYFITLLSPTNEMRYDPVQFYNAALGIFAGYGAGALSFRLLPPLSPAFRTRRLLAAGRTYRDWDGHIGGRLVTMPDAATPLQRAQLLAALSAGSEIIQLRDSARRLSLDAELDPVLVAVAQGDTTSATAHLASLDEALAAGAASEPGAQTVLRAHASILVLFEALSEHAAYFDPGRRREVRRDQPFGGLCRPDLTDDGRRLGRHDRVASERRHQAALLNAQDLPTPDTSLSKHGSRTIAPSR